MSVLRISMFNQIRIVHTNHSIVPTITRTSQALLAYLLLHQSQNHSRERLAGILWCDYSQDRARRCLNTALWRLRQILEPPEISRGSYLLTGSSGDVGFNWESDHWLDMTAFEEPVRRISSIPLDALQLSDIQTLEDALQLYSGDLLEGFYDDWVLRAREHLRKLYLSGQAILMAYHKQHGAINKSLAHAQILLDHDPIREEVHREIMRLYWETGQRSLAIRQYETCRQIMTTELGIQPMEETQHLYAQIIENVTSADVIAPYETPTSFQQVYQQLKTAMRVFDDSYIQLRQAMHRVDALANQDDTQDPTIQ